MYVGLSGDALSLYPPMRRRGVISVCLALACLPGSAANPASVNRVD